MVGTRSASTCSTAPPLALHLLLKLVEEAPVGALGDDLLRGTLDQANLVQAQGIKAHRVFWVIFPPAIIGNLLQRLQGIVVARRETLLHHALGGAVGFEGTEVCRLQNGAQRPLGSDRMFAHELAVASHDAAEILGPWTIRGAIDHRVPDLL